MIRVLCIEDNSLMVDYLHARLGMEPDIRVVGVTDSPDRALEHLTWEAVDVVLLDYQLTGGNGLQLLRSLSANGSRAPERRPAVLFCTGQADGELVSAARQGGASGVVSKARIAKELVPALRAVASGECWFTGAS